MKASININQNVQSIAEQSQLENLMADFALLSLDFPFEDLLDIQVQDIPHSHTWDSAKMSKFLELQEKAHALLTPEERVVKELNKKHAAIHIDQFYILTEKENLVFGGLDFSLESRQSLLQMYENQLIVCSDGKIRNKAKIWLSHLERRFFPNGITFDPTTILHVGGCYNLWSGFAFVPVKGSCVLFKQFILKIICSNNKLSFQHTWKWCAYVCQYPHKIHTALLLMGLQGTGKSTFAKTLGKLFGKHFVHLDSLERLMGNFNYHLKNTVLVFADEAIWGGNRKDIGKLKAMITEELAMIEPKGKDTIPIRNFRHFIFSSNEDWPVHLDPDDRRIFVLKVSDQHKEDQSYFEAINSELANGGYEALLFDLLNEDLSNFNPRLMPTNIDAFSVKMESASSVQKYLFAALNEECFDIGNASPNQLWPKQIQANSMFADYTAWCDREKIQPEKRGRLGSALARHIPSIKKHRPGKKSAGQHVSPKRPSFYSIPSLDKAREDFQKSFKVGSEIWD